MANNVFGVEMAEADAFDAFEDLRGLNESRALALGQIDLGRVTGDYSRRAEADSRKEHLHLRRCGVLAFIKNYEGVIERAAAHVSQRCDFNDAFLNKPAHALKAKHFIQCIVERA